LTTDIYAALATKPKYRKPLIRLMHLVGERFKFLASVKLNHIHPKDVNRSLDEAIAAATKSFRKLTPEDQEGVCRLLLQVRSLELANRWTAELPMLRSDEKAVMADLVQPSLEHESAAVATRYVREALAGSDAVALYDMCEPARLKGRKLYAYTRASLQLQIVELHAALRNAGMSKREAEKLARKAAERAPSDVRRKWRPAAEALLGVVEVEAVGAHVRAFASACDRQEIAAELRAIGARYKKIGRRKK
jgi:hypothetical protein